MNDEAKQRDIRTVEAALSGEAAEAFHRLMGDWSQETADWQSAAGMNCAGTPEKLRKSVERKAHSCEEECCLPK